MTNYLHKNNRSLVWNQRRAINNPLWAKFEPFHPRSHTHKTSFNSFIMFFGRSVCISAAHTSRVFMKFGIAYSNENLPKNYKFRYNWTKKTVHITWRSKYAYCCLRHKLAIKAFAYNNQFFVVDRDMYLTTHSLVTFLLQQWLLERTTRTSSIFSALMYVRYIH